MKPYPDRLRVWEKIAAHLPIDRLDAMTHPATLTDLPALGAAILQGRVQGRIVVDVNG